MTPDGAFDKVCFVDCETTGLAIIPDETARPEPPPPTIEERPPPTPGWLKVARENPQAFAEAINHRLLAEGDTPGPEEQKLWEFIRAFGGVRYITPDLIRDFETARQLDRQAQNPPPTQPQEPTMVVVNCTSSTGTHMGASKWRTTKKEKLIILDDNNNEIARYPTGSWVNVRIDQLANTETPATQQQ